MSALISTFATQKKKLQFLKDKLSLNITPKELKISPCIKFYYLLTEYMKDHIFELLRKI